MNWIFFRDKRCGRKTKRTDKDGKKRWLRWQLASKEIYWERQTDKKNKKETQSGQKFKIVDKCKDNKHSRKRGKRHWSKEKFTIDRKTDWMDRKTKRMNKGEKDNTAGEEQKGQH